MADRLRGYQSFCAKHRRCHSGASVAAQGFGGARLHHGPPYRRSPRRFREKGIKYENQKVAFCLSKGRLFSLRKIYKIPLDRMDIQLYVINKHTLVGKRGEPHGKTEITRYRAQGHAGSLAYRPPCQHLCRPRGAAKGTPLEFTALQTLLGRLVRRGFLQTENRAKAAIIPPSSQRRIISRRIAAAIFQKWTGGSLRDLVACLYVNHSVTKEDLEELKAFIEDETEG